MGAYISTIILMVGVITVGVLASMTANYSRKMNWSSAEKMGIIASVVAALFAIIAIIILIVVRKNAKGPSLQFGAMASFIFLIIATIGACAMNILAVLAAKKNDKSRAEGLSAGSAALMFFAFIATIVMIFLI